MDATNFLRSLFQKYSQKEHLREATPLFHGTYPAPGTCEGTYDVGSGGLRLDSHDCAKIRMITATSPTGALRQCMLPNDWDGKTVVVIMGGAGVYVASYAGWIAHLVSGNATRPGLAVLWEDLTGYGYSVDGRFAAINDYMDLVEPQVRLVADISSFLGRVGIRPILAGFSLGGQVALHVANKIPDHISGVVAISPLVQPYGKIGSPWVRWLVSLMASLPWFGTRYIYRDALRGDAYRVDATNWYHTDYLRRKSEDAYFDDSVLLRSLRAILRGGDDLLRRTPSPHLPIQIIHSVADRTCAFAASEQLFAHVEAKGSRMVLRALAGYPHQLLNLKAPDCYDVFGIIDEAVLEVMSLADAEV